MRDALAGSRVTTLTGGFGELLSFAKSRSDDKVAPIPVIPATATKPRGSPRRRRSRLYETLSPVTQAGHCGQLVLKKGSHIFV
jgi:hypothetical protein